MDRLTDDEAENLSELMARNEIKDLILLLRDKHDLPLVLKTIESWLSAAPLSILLLCFGY